MTPNLYTLNLNKGKDYPKWNIWNNDKKQGQD